MWNVTINSHLLDFCFSFKLTLHFINKQITQLFTSNNVSPLLEVNKVIEVQPQLHFKGKQLVQCKLCTTFDLIIYIGFPMRNTIAKANRRLMGLVMFNLKSLIYQCCHHFFLLCFDFSSWTCEIMFQGHKGLASITDSCSDCLNVGLLFTYHLCSGWATWNSSFLTNNP